MGITTVRDLLFYFPRSYEDLSIITPVGDSREQANVCIEGALLDMQELRTFKKHMSLATGIIQDASGSLRVLWFNQPYIVTTLKKGERVCLTGKIARDKQGLFLSNPAYELLDGRERVHTGRIVPIYQETAGVSSKWLRSVIWRVIKEVPRQDVLPESIVKGRGLLSFSEALQEIHFPSDLKRIEQAQFRFAFEELFMISLLVLSERKKLARVKAHAVPMPQELMARFTKSLPFRLTDSQKKAAWSILKDLEKPRPMNRLLQGDVGSGKTVVAAMAALAVAKAGLQTVFMAPTEILARQHFATAGALLSTFKLQVGLLTGKTDQYISPKLPKEPIEISRAKLLQKALNGDIDVLIGTQALIRDKVKFGKLALVVLDEQHRFGVNQRANLVKKPAKTADQLIPHLLSMTATPIPRTLALTMYGDLDLTLLSEMPPGRKEVVTRIVTPEGRADAYRFIAKQVSSGRQAFVICPRIDPTEQAEMKTVKEEYETLSKKIFPNLAVGMLHGKMAQKEKEEVMKKFRRGKIDILVSTSVIEVGIDIPNATVMVIEGAERFGLAQLHQFRGRVGRGSHQSFCLLFSESSSGKTRMRLKAILESKNGFELAEQDLRLRGPGDFAGVKQWGMPDFAMNQLTNLELVQQARKAATALLEQDIALRSYPLLAARIRELQEKLHLE